MKIIDMDTKRISYLNKYQTFKDRSYLFVISILFSPMAYANSDMVESVIKKVSQWLSGPLAVSVGTLVIAYSGYEMTKGQLDKDSFIYRMAGIGMVIGAGFLGKNFFAS